MMYLWEVLLKADEQSMPRQHLRFTHAANPSPYKEVAYDEINRNFVTTEPIEINAYYRYSAIFTSVINGLDEYPELRDTLFDILTHFLAELNTYEGLCKKEYHARLLQADVQAGKYGARYKDIFATFEPKQIRHVTESMVRLYEAGPSIELTKTLLRKIYPRSISYFNTVAQRELLVYIGRKETPDLRKQVDFLLSLFVPVDCIVHLFWEKHFGIIGVNETLELGEFVIY